MQGEQVILIKKFPIAHFSLSHRILIIFPDLDLVGRHNLEITLIAFLPPKSYPIDSRVKKTQLTRSQAHGCGCGCGCAQPCTFELTLLHAHDSRCASGSVR